MSTDRIFMELKVATKDWQSLRLSPPMMADQVTDKKLLDEVWHLHIEMDCYEEDCKLLSGEGAVIEHKPVLYSSALPRYANTYDLYLQHCRDNRLTPNLRLWCATLCHLHLRPSTS